MRSVDLYATYSIVAADADEIGVAVQTHQMAVGGIVPWLKPGVGAVATQSLVNISLGPLGLSLLEQGVSPEKVIAALTASDTDSSRRQLAVIDPAGTAAGFTGSGCIREAGHRSGYGYSVQANMMYTTTVVDAMAEAFEQSQGRLPERMLLAMEAAQANAGDIRGMQSAALVTVSTDPATPSWARRFDLRVDESRSPLDELSRLVRLRRAQHIDGDGHSELENGNIPGALERWKEARRLAPELEELGFWQAVTLAEKYPDQLDTAQSILNGSLAAVPLATPWRELIDRLEACGLLTTSGLRARLDPETNG
ncbi:MAG: DUF1028 domain-containing protein [Spirochaetales bacterium]|nr:MAG: DUF1028 domain-containing protein [Spirochaetales bacterium]